MNKTIDLRMGDCIAGMGTIPDGCIDVIFADPPYNLSGKAHLTVRSGRPVKCDKGEWDVLGDLHQFNLQWLAECVRVLSDQGTLWISGTLHNHPSVGMALKELGLWIINDVVWFKRNATPLLGRNRLAPSTELIWVAAKSKKYRFNYEVAKRINGGKQMKNLWDIKAERHRTSHPTEKPESLLSRIVAIASQPGELIMDPFMGSGTTGVVAKKMGCKFIGFENNSEYFQMARERIDQAPDHLFIYLHSGLPPSLPVPDVPSATKPSMVPSSADLLPLPVGSTV